jgi:hypothetical protein
MNSNPYQAGSAEHILQEKIEKALQNAKGCLDEAQSLQDRANEARNNAAALLRTIESCQKALRKLNADQQS